MIIGYTHSENTVDPKKVELISGNYIYEDGKEHVSEIQFSPGKSGVKFKPFPFEDIRAVEQLITKICNVNEDKAALRGVFATNIGYLAFSCLRDEKCYLLGDDYTVTTPVKYRYTEIRLDNLLEQLAGTEIPVSGTNHAVFRNAKLFIEQLFRGIPVTGTLPGLYAFNLHNLMKLKPGADYSRLKAFIVQMHLESVQLKDEHWYINIPAMRYDHIYSKFLKLISNPDKLRVNGHSDIKLLRKNESRFSANMENVEQMESYGLAFENYVSQDEHDYITKRLGASDVYDPVQTMYENSMPTLSPVNDTAALFVNRFSVILSSYEKETTLGLRPFTEKITHWLNNGNEPSKLFLTNLQKDDKTFLLNGLVTALECRASLKVKDEEVIEAIMKVGFGKAALKKHFKAVADK